MRPFGDPILSGMAALAGFVVLLAGCSWNGGEGRMPREGPVGFIAFNQGGSIRLLDVGTGASTILVERNTYDRPLVWMPGGARLVYWNHDGGAWDLWAVDPDSRSARNLTGTARDSRSAAPSPDGRLIAFLRGGDGLWLMNADGSGQRQLDPRGHRDAPPAWSPSGRRLAFTDLESAEQGRVALQAYCIEMEGDRAVERVSLGRGEVGCFLDEEWVVLAASHEGQRELVAVNVGSGERRPLTSSPDVDHLPVVSPDRGRIAWVASGEEGSQLMVMEASARDARPLCAIAHFFAPPTFSPDGRYLAFESGSERGAAAIHVIPVAAGPPRAMTEAGSGFPVWRPMKR